MESLKLSSFRNAETATIFRAPDADTRLLAPSLHNVEGELYIYFTIGKGDSHHVFVKQCMDPSNPLGEWSKESRLLPNWNRAVHHPSLLQFPSPSEHEEPRLYLLWTSHETGVAYHLYIAKMEGPTTANSTPRILRSPNSDRGEGNINNSPFAFRRNRRTFLTFVTDNQYGRCLRIMGIDCELDPMIHLNWWDDVQHCAFEGNETAEIVVISRASFVMSPGKTMLNA